MTAITKASITFREVLAFAWRPVRRIPGNRPSPGGRGLFR
jgi:hypothetical protein